MPLHFVLVTLKEAITRSKISRPHLHFMSPQKWNQTARKRIFGNVNLSNYLYGYLKNKVCRHRRRDFYQQKANWSRRGPARNGKQSDAELLTSSAVVFLKMETNVCTKYLLQQNKHYKINQMYFVS